MAPEAARDPAPAGHPSSWGFDDPAAVARYADGPARFVPGFADLHRMTTILLSEKAPEDGRILVLGAGGGLELSAMAEARPGWSFVGVDPSAEMLKEAGRALGRHAGRASLVRGVIDDAPAGPFDAATCLLTLHFLGAAERRRTLAEIRRRLRPGAPLVIAHCSIPRGGSPRSEWLDRYAAFAVASGFDREGVDKARAAVDANLELLDPDADARILGAAGFRDVELFYAAFTWRGWVAYA